MNADRFRFGVCLAGLSVVLLRVTFPTPLSDALDAPCLEELCETKFGLWKHTIPVLFEDCKCVHRIGDKNAASD